MTLNIHYTDHRDRPKSQSFSHEETDSLVIGRRDARFTPDVNLTWERSVSRQRHARIFYEYGTWHIEHLKPKNRTLLDGKLLMVGVPEELPSEAVITVGNAELKITHDQVDSIPDGVISERHAAAETNVGISEDKRLEVLSKVKRILASETDQPLQFLLDAIRPYFQTMECGGISLYRDKEIFHPAFYPPGEAEISNRLARRALQERQAFRWDRTVATGKSGQFTSLTGTIQAIYAPILRGVQGLGIIYLHTKQAFSTEDLSLLRAIAEIIGADSNFEPESAHLRLPSVFVSYSSKDKEFVEDFVADVRRQRVTVWFDERLRVGKDWKEQLAEAIQQSDALALVMSPDSLDSEWVEWEIEKAREMGKPIFPLWHQVCEDVPDDLDRLQRIDLIDNYQGGVLELVRELYELSGEEDTLDSQPVVMRSPGKDEKIRILFLAANPLDTDRLRLDEEIRTIQDRIRGGKYRDQFDVIRQANAVRYSDLELHLLDYDPHIIHFSGHGSSDGALIFEDNSGNTEPLSKETLRLLFSALNDGTSSLQCVILNACFSAVQADAIADEVNCVLGMTRAVSDPGAIEFSASFYRALTYARSVQTAFNLASAALSRSGEAETPQLIAHTIDPNNLIFCEETSS